MGKKNTLNPVFYSPAEGDIQKLAVELLQAPSKEGGDMAYKIWYLIKPTAEKNGY
ncbi:MAG: hypothetical protein ACI8VC_002772 [Candidatus Endobugula sp.]|jgi:hypothetical protein